MSRILPTNLIAGIVLVLSILAGLYSLSLPIIQMTPMVGVAVWLGVLAIALKQDTRPRSE